MIEEQLAQRGINDQRVLKVMDQIPREEFIPYERRNQAYIDGPVSIGLGQTISQPYIVALMTELLELEGKEKVLEIGTGSGYQAAVLAKLAK
jgi:protein-L-isoaspartate(D-aspartate) O-methyltransferase